VRRISVSVLVLFYVMLCIPVQAADRKTNIWASWVNATSSLTTLTLPVEVVGNITIKNGDSTDPVCVSLRGETIQNSCLSNGFSTINLAASDSIEVYDFTTSSITLRGIVNAASPVSVVVTY